jgi:para-aminobenzoate synthetase component 2
MATKILVVDNYDSFVFNLVQYLAQLGAECTVLRNDEVKVSDAQNYDGVLISPGPGIPEAAGVSIELVQFCAENKIPLLGVCLGHQAIGVATRYHSLAIERDSISSKDSELEITGWTESGIVMAVCHKSLPIHGVQFHPESVLTEGGHQLLANWLTICGDKSALEKSKGLSPVIGK